MDLAKFAAALSIALFASFFLVEILSLAYKAPDFSSCSASSLCTALIEKTCGKEPATYDPDSAYYRCQTTFYSSAEYTGCISDAQKTQESCQNNLATQYQTYQIVSFLLYGLGGILFIIVGFLM